MLGLIRPCTFVALLLILAIGGLTDRVYSSVQAKAAASANSTAPVTLPADTRVEVFTAETGEWTRTTFTAVKAGSEFTYDGRLYRMGDLRKAEMVPGVDVSRLADADKPYDSANHRAPRADDVVQVLSQDMRVSRHAVLGTVQPGSRIRFQGRAYDLATDRSLRDTGIVASGAPQTSGSKTNTLVDLEIRSADGKVSLVTGTPAHRLYVPSANGYVAMDRLATGTVLKTADGSAVTVTSVKPRNGSSSAPNAGGARQHGYSVSANGLLVRDTGQVPWVTELPGEEKQAVLGTLRYIDGRATPSGPLATKWGTTFRNVEGRLPRNVAYREYRVAPSPGTRGPGARRIVVGSDGAVYYTRDHYVSFVRIR